MFSSTWLGLSPVSGFPQLSGGAYLPAENSQDGCKCSAVWVGGVHVLGTAPGIVRSEPGVASQQHDLQPATGCVGGSRLLPWGDLGSRTSLSFFQSISLWHLLASPLPEVSAHPEPPRDCHVNLRGSCLRMARVGFGSLGPAISLTMEPSALQLPKSCCHDSLSFLPPSF